MIHLGLLVGELACAVGRCLVDHIWRLDFGVAGLVGLVEEELDEGALQACAFADVDGESGSGDFHPEVEVDEVVFPCQVPVGKRVLGEVGHRAADFLDHVILGRFPFGHHVAGKVGDSAEQLVELLLDSRQAGGDFLLGILEGAHLGLGLVGLILLALLHQLAYGGGDAVELSRLVVIVELQLAAALVEREDVVDRRLAVETLDGQTRHHMGGVGLYLL